MTECSHSIEDLKGAENERYHAIDWTLQRVARWTIGLILVAALLGFFGQGPMVRRHASAADQSLRVKYYAVERYENPTVITCDVYGIAENQQTIDLRLSRRFCDNSSIESITPQPKSVVAWDDDIHYGFDVRDCRQATIVIRFTHQDPGPTTFEIAVVGREPVSITQYVLP